MGKLEDMVNEEQKNKIKDSKVTIEELVKVIWKTRNRKALGMDKNKITGINISRKYTKKWFS